MTKDLKASVSSNSTQRSPTDLDGTHESDHVLVELRAWKQSLVARGNRLLELALREREALAGRDAAVGSSDTASYSDGVFKDRASARLKRLA